MNGNEEFAKRITDLRKDKALSQKELGELLGVSNKAVSKWETGESMPQMKTVIKLAEIFEISPNELLTGTRLDINTADSGADEATLQAEESIKQAQSLEEENKRLSMKLKGAEKSRRNTILICFAVCLVCAAAAILIALSNPTDRDKLNGNVDSVGKSNTYIEFGGEEFYPANDWEQELYYSNYNEDKRYAVIYDENKKSQELTVYCDKDSEFLTVPKNGREYIYVSKKGRINFSAENVMNVYICNSNILAEREQEIRSGYYNDLEEALIYGDWVLIDREIYDSEDIKEFFKIYDNRTKPDNARAITKQYMTEDAQTVVIYINNGYDIGGCIKLGSLFEDNKGNYYIYSFEDSETYLLGKELKNLVEKEY